MAVRQVSLDIRPAKTLALSESGSAKSVTRFDPAPVAYPRSTLGAEFSQGRRSAAAKEKRLRQVPRQSHLD